MRLNSINLADDDRIESRILHQYRRGLQCCGVIVGQRNAEAVPFRCASLASVLK